MKIKDKLRERRGVAFEFFAPRTEAGEKSLFEHLERLEEIQPAYVSVTYGAGGTSREHTHRIVLKIAKFGRNTVMAHLTAIGHSRDEVYDIVNDYREHGVENIMALRGDKPKDPTVQLKQGDFPHASDLIRFLREQFGDHFTIGGAAFPEIHPESPDLEHEIRFFKEKISAGMDFAVSQMFFDNTYFYRYIDRLEHEGIDLPFIPGIMPITNFGQIRKMAELSQANIPSSLIDKLDKVSDNDDEAYKIGVDFAVRQCQDLADNGFRFLHFFTLNKSNATLEIYRALQGV